MSEKELLYVEDAVNHEIYMINLCNDVGDCLTIKELRKTVNQIKKTHENILKELMSVLKEN